MTVSSSELLDGRDLISVKSLHTEASLSHAQKMLARAISSKFEGSLLNNDIFADRVVRALVIRGNCRGLCCLCPDGGGTVLARWLRTEIRMSCYEQHVTDDLVKRSLQFVDELDFFLLSLMKGPDFPQLFVEPHPTENRLIYFQWKMSIYPAYDLFAAIFHRGICRKVDQMDDVSVKQFDSSLGSMTRVLGYIVEGFPKEKVRQSIYDYQFGELYRIVREVVDTMPRRRKSSTGMNVMAAITRDRRYAIFITVVNGKAAARNFRECSKSTRKTQEINEKDQWRLDELFPDHALLQPLDKIIAEQAKEENRNITKGRKGKRGGSAQSGLDKIRPGKAVRVFNPRRSQPGCLPLYSLFLINTWLDELEVEKDIPESRLTSVLFNLMLHLGRPIAWLLSLRLGREPQSIYESTHPIYSSKAGRIYTFPVRDFSNSRNAQSGKYAEVSAVYPIILPQPLKSQMDTYLRERTALVKCHRSTCEALGISETESLLFLLEEDDGIYVPTKEWAVSRLRSANQFLKEQVPSHPTISDVDYRRTFQGYYADFGLRSLYRSHISGRMMPYDKMPLNYSRVSIDLMTEEYHKAFDAFLAEFEQEARTCCALNE